MQQRVSDEDIEMMLDAPPPPAKPTAAPASGLVGPLVGEGIVVGRRAPDFTLQDHNAYPCRLSEVCKESAVLLVFYPADFTPVCTKQLCNYRDSLDSFRRVGIQLLGLSTNSTETHSSFAKTYDFPFRLLSDEKHRVARQYGCSSAWMLGGISRAVFIVNRSGIILYRYIEPTIFTRRTSRELLSIVDDLSAHHLL